MSDCSCSKQDGFANCCKLKIALARSERAEEECARLNDVIKVATNIGLDAAARIQSLEAENERLRDALQGITEDGHTECEWCSTHEQMACEALNPKGLP